MNRSAPHLPVLPAIVDDLLGRGFERPVGWILDGTLGAAGHSRLLLEAHPTARLLGLDRDPSALVLATERLGPLAERSLLVHSTFADGARAAQDAQAGPFDVILLDIGISSMQVDQPERGFSFMREGPLDMRMDPTQGPSAADLIADLDEVSLANLIYELGEERGSRRIAAALVDARRRSPIRTTTALAEIVTAALPRPRAPRGRRKRPIHPATKTFQALRLAVNDELGQLERALPALWELLSPGGRLGVISFHSLEDRIAKNFLRGLKQEKRARVLTKKPRTADEEEIERNPRARSAKFRVGEKRDPADAIPRREPWP
ncbi:MAG: 16S rRNA (cytosine(1402)-N(4))-methyltransferase RsmH [Planctomycetes bacterium]|nr:16S rRNA (cytosine(1402)-N(4))-methyltransferase RsmH [Planctomycetota bacterium]